MYNLTLGMVRVTVVFLVPIFCSSCLVHTSGVESTVALCFLVSYTNEMSGLFLQHYIQKFNFWWYLLCCLYFCSWRICFHSIHHSSELFLHWKFLDVQQFCNQFLKISTCIFAWTSACFSLVRLRTSLLFYTTLII